MHRAVVLARPAEQHLVQLLARPQAGVDDLDRAGRLWRPAARATSSMRTGSPMSSTSASPSPPMAPAWIDELHRLLDGHEVAGDVGVGDGDGPPAVDLGAGTR